MSQATHAVSETGGENVIWSPAQQWNRDSPSAATAGFVSLSSSSAGEKRLRDGSSAAKDRQEGKSGGAEPDHEIHIWTERERRKKMRNMFSSLHALLPHLPAKADKSTVVDEAVKHIKALQQKLENLEKQKLEHLHGEGRQPPPPPPPPPAAGLDQTASTAVSREAFLADLGKNYYYFPTNSPSQPMAPGRFPQSLQTWSSPNVVLSVSGDDAFICIGAPKKPGLLSTVVAVMEKHKLDLLSASVSADFFRTMIMIHARASDAGGQLPETLMNEEIYKLAVGEMIIWLSTSPTH